LPWQTDLLGMPRARRPCCKELEQRSEQGARELLAGLPKQNVIVHVHGWRALSPSIARPSPPAAAGVYTVHEYSCFAQWRLLQLSKGRSLLAEALSASCFARIATRSAIPQDLARRALAHGEAAGAIARVFSDYICLSDFQRESSALSASRRRVTRISNPIDAPISPQGNPAAASLFCRRLSPEKACFCSPKPPRSLAYLLHSSRRPAEEELRARFPTRDCLLAGQRNVRQRCARQALVFPSLWFEPAAHRA